MFVYETKNTGEFYRPPKFSGVIYHVINLLLVKFAYDVSELLVSNLGNNVMIADYGETARMCVHQ